ncbi:hypothetical protein [Leptospira interrogans]|uniref:Uncharacterized protein n=2 Tax=Leptospira interrogans TaxID=173 RepID=A0A0F6HDR8_LEPIR|nr:hypothetical protein [Leptospira interrogans]EKO26474.1 hypothetical protein LEP1GSC104_3195 [Leptospira interrogans str. UI 12621]MBM2888889.1 hypothetical protein [Leptospira interrogans]QOI52419.1 hypothetical protein Lepto1489_19780 [Leptospira interrogans serovar Bataviae]
MEENNFNIKADFIGINATTIFPITNFSLCKVGEETIFTFYFNDGSSDPDLCINVSLTQGGLIDFRKKCEEIATITKIEVRNWEHYKHLKWKKNKSIRVAPPKRTNIFGIGRINDSYDIMFGYIHPLMARVNDGNQINITTPIIYDISMSRILFELLLLELRKVGH